VVNQHGKTGRARSDASGRATPRGSNSEASVDKNKGVKRPQSSGKSSTYKGDGLIKKDYEHIELSSDDDI
jgi:hypothetical protein